MPSPTTIIFGPTGGVASTAARTVHKHGTKVVLAMRDPSKTVPGMETDVDNVERVHADLTDPETVRTATCQSSAKRAFLYMAFASTDNMRSTIEALKTSGVEYVVFLSSFTYSGHPRNARPDRIVEQRHASVELNLLEIFGSHGYVAVRPGYFASNARRLVSFNNDKLQISYPDVRYDWIVPEDMGLVCGNLLLAGKSDDIPDDGARIVELCGRDMLSQREIVNIIEEKVGRSIPVEAVDDETALEQRIRRGVAEPVARYLVRHMRELDETTRRFYSEQDHRKGLENIKRYTGREATGFREWIDQNVALFQ